MDYNNVRDLNDRLHQLEGELEKYKSIDLEEIQKLVYFANTMQNLLIQCRNEQIDYILARQIDDVLGQLEE